MAAPKKKKPGPRKKQRQPNAPSSSRTHKQPSPAQAPSLRRRNAQGRVLWMTLAGALVLSVFLHEVPGKTTHTLDRHTRSTR